MGEVISLDAYRERREIEPAEIDREAIGRRMAQIGLEILLLQSEKNRLEHLLLSTTDPGA